MKKIFKDIGIACLSLPALSLISLATAFLATAVSTSAWGNSCAADITAPCTLPTNGLNMNIAQSLSNTGQPLITSSPPGTLSPEWNGSLTVDSGVKVSSTLHNQSYIDIKLLDSAQQFLTNAQFSFSNVKQSSSRSGIYLSALGIMQSHYGMISLTGENILIDNAGYMKGNLEALSANATAALFMLSSQSAKISNEGDMISSVASTVQSGQYSALYIQEANILHIDNIGSIALKLPAQFSGALDKGSAIDINTPASMQGLSAEIINENSASIEGVSAAVSFKFPADSAGMSDVDIINYGAISAATNDAHIISKDPHGAILVKLASASITQQNTKISIENYGIISGVLSPDIDSLTGATAIRFGFTGTSSRPNEITLEPSSQTYGSLIGSGVMVGQKTTSDELHLIQGTLDRQNKPTTLLSGDYVEGFQSITVDTALYTNTPQAFLYQASVEDGQQTASSLTIRSGVRLALAEGSRIAVDTISVEEGASLSGAGDITLTQTSILSGNLNPTFLNNKPGTFDLDIQNNNMLIANPSASITSLIDKAHESGNLPLSSSLIVIKSGSFDMSAMPIEHVQVNITSGALATLLYSGLDVSLPIIEAQPNATIIFPNSLSSNDTLSIVNKLLYSVALKKNGQTLEAQLSVNPKNKGRIANVGGLTENIKYIAQFFDNLSASVFADAPLTNTSRPSAQSLSLLTIYNSLINSQSAQDITLDIRPLEGQIYGDIEQEVANSSKRLSTYIMEKLIRSGLNENYEWHIAISPFFNETLRGKNMDQFSTKSSDVGFNLSASKKFSKNWIAGASLQYNRTTLEIAHVTHSANLDNVHLALFAGYDVLNPLSRRRYDRFYMQSALTYTASVATVSRYIWLTNYASSNVWLNEDAHTAKPLTHVLRFTAQTGYSFDVGYGIEIGPYARLDVGWLKRQESSESGPLATAIDVEAASSFVGNAIVGGRLHWEFKRVHTFASRSIRKAQKPYGQLFQNLGIEASFGWDGQFGPQIRDVKYKTAGQPNTLTSRAHDSPGLVGMLWGAGITSKWDDNTLALRYDGSYANPGAQLSNTISLTMGMAF